MVSEKDSLVRCSENIFEEVKSKLKMSISVTPGMHKLNNTEEMDNS